MNLLEWENKYEPITNHLDSDASFEGMMFETYGDELEFVKAQTNNRIWTFQDGDYGDLIITNGYHLFNRIGYFVTRVPWEDYVVVELKRRTK
jgi:hypothetical protein